MSFLVPLLMFAWIPIVLYLFYRFPTQRAVVISFLVAWLFLPQAKFSIPGLPDYTKISATCYGVLIASFIFDSQRLSSFKFSRFDIPMVIWCICPFFSSLTNGLGAYDGLSSALGQTVVWGIPYFLGRIYLNSLSGLYELARGIFFGGLIYIPLCLFEIRMSPQLHNILYGFHPHSFAQTKRMGGFRPTVFMEHGLEVGMWMMAATLIGILIWKMGYIDRIYGMSIPLLVAVLLITFILIKSTGAYALLFLGIVLFFVASQFRTSILLLIIITSISIYLGNNTITQNHVGEQIIPALQKVFVEDRVESVQFRVDNEILVKEKAQQRIFFGWGGWNRNRVYDYNTRGELVDISVLDSLWIITFSKYGLVGIASLYLSFIVPIFGFIKCYPAMSWSKPQVAPAAVLTVILLLFMVDCLLNSMINPIFILACGGVSGLVTAKIS